MRKASRPPGSPPRLSGQCSHSVRPPRTPADKPRDLHIVIETIDHSQQRYPTVGDWQIDKAGNLHITVSKMGDQRYEFLVGMHEAIEAYLAVHAGISSAAVDKFDEAYEATRKRGAPLDNGWPRMTLVRYDHARPQRPRHRGDAE